MFKKIARFFTNGIDYRLKEIYWKDEEGKHYVLWIKESILGDIKIVAFGTGKGSQGGWPLKAELTRRSPNIPTKIKTFISMLGRHFKY
ncbi:hypothetical protein I6G82_02670 [Lysinibacillus macroides]|uniref:Uncharacterized protein n=1 Tax=Lysinibacillus macroides TaxID=33935 RepID=A0A0M9DIH4_9BACI|nr:hypothetical protein [Lysinibacillus macroides]KOY81283.1 hypothetical protein ADM90_19300 [Lysinibacillus macroides]QPR68554.1 hypothetical protein I6G82_02670 [Lysinibacillus macroides]